MKKRTTQKRPANATAPVSWSSRRRGRLARLFRDDPTRPSVTVGTPSRGMLNKVAEGVDALHLLLLALPFSLVVGFLASLGLPLQPTKNLLADACLVGLLPWGGAFVVYKLIERVRRRRFGAEQARPPLSSTDAILLTLAGTSGPPMLLFSGPHLFTAHETADRWIVGIGAFFCGYTILAIRRLLREA